jgi:Holliday junction DNA helicase RuvA
MISFLEGTLTAKHPTEALVEVGGVGLQCRISLATYAALPDVGSQVHLVTQLITRDDGMDLYGFISEAERTLFGLLKGVSGVGPRMAQGILSGLSVEEFAQALATENLATLTAIRGVGRKTAERLVLELKEKLHHLEEVTGAPVSSDRKPAEEVPSWEEEAILALRSLGYGAADAEAAVRRAVQDLEGEPTVEIVVKRALTLAR